MKRKNKGFTLIEILIVLAIIGVVASIGIRKFNRSENLKTSVRKLTAVIKKSRSYAKLNNQTYRLVIQIDEKNQKYWVEGSSKPTLIDPNEKENSKKFDSKDKEGKSPSDFANAPEIIKKPNELPPEWKFVSIESAVQKNDELEGLHYIYFFPQGISEEAIIQIGNKNAAKTSIWSIYISPHATQSQIFTEAKALKDFY